LITGPRNGHGPIRQVRHCPSPQRSIAAITIVGTEIGRPFAAGWRLRTKGRVQWQGGRQSTVVHTLFGTSFEHGLRLSSELPAAVRRKPAAASANALTGHLVHSRSIGRHKPTRSSCRKGLTPPRPHQSARRYRAVNDASDTARWKLLGLAVFALGWGRWLDGQISASSVKVAATRID